MAADINVFPGSQSVTGLAEGSDLVAQDFLVAMLNYGETRPYLPKPPVLPITQLFLHGGNIPSLGEVALAFSLSLPGIRNIMQTANPDYRSAKLIDIRYTETLGEVSMTIQIQTTATNPIYVQKTLKIGTLDG